MKVCRSPPSEAAAGPRPTRSASRGRDGPGAAYPEVRINAVEAEVGTFLDGLLERLPLGRSRLDALASSGLFVLDAVIDPDEPSPLGRRFQSLGDEVGSAVEVAGASSGGSAAKRDMIHSDGAFGLCLTKADDANV